LVLNVFHWLGDNKNLSISEWDNLFIKVINAAKITFFEVPNNYSKQETRHKIGTWYNHMSVAETLNRVINQYKLNVIVKKLCDVDHGTKGKRELFIIVNNDNSVFLNKTDLTNVIQNS
jgi:hypothetical protein